MATSAVLWHRVILALKFSPVSSVFWVFSDYSCLANAHLALNIDNGLDCLLSVFAPGTRELMYVNILKSLLYK